ncbi:hypothetical protein D3C87_2017890 [compost metagenome]
MHFIAFHLSEVALRPGILIATNHHGFFVSPEKKNLLRRIQIMKNPLFGSEIEVRVETVRKKNFKFGHSAILPWIKVKRLQVL